MKAFEIAEKSRVRSSALVFGLIIVASVAVVAYTSAYVRRSLNKVSQANTRVVEANHDAEDARLRAEHVRNESQKELRNAREATKYVTDGINDYHQGHYAAAVNSYDEALKLDPRNPYILNLKGYALFKERDYQDAIAALNSSVEMNPDYAWGYFDLARAQCAVQDFERARNSVSMAIEKAKANGRDLRATMRADGEFTRLCAPISNAYLK